MLQRRPVVFAIQLVALAVIWGLFLTLVAKHPLDGWFWAQVIGVGLIVASIALWRTSRADKRQGKT
jgi:membrane protease YdiL (CAAX protease family)